jgi:hypothetical protein
LVGKCGGDRRGVGVRRKIEYDAWVPREVVDIEDEI